jgi:RND superfamily putative drug exporter
MRLTVESGPDAGAGLEIEEGQVVIGRDDDCQLVLHDELVSRRHASIDVLPDGRAVVVDFGSSNGTFLNGARVSGPVELEGREHIRIGNSVIAVSLPRGRTTVAPRGAVLRIESGERRGQLVEVTGSDFEIGRDDSCDLVIPDPTVSARHASLSVLPTGRIVLEDLGSRNGTFVNGRQIYAETELAGGERVRLGDTVVTLVGQKGPGVTAVAEVGAWLTVDSGPAQGMIVKVTGKEFVIGRHEGCDLVLPDAGVSHEHASLEVVGPGRAVIADLGSRNGTFVDGQQLYGVEELRGGERLRVGGTELVFGESALKPPVPVEAVIQATRRRSPLSTEALARVAMAKPWTVIAIWVAALIGGTGLAAVSLSGVLTAEKKVGGNPDSIRADELVEQRLRGPRRLTEFVVLRSERQTVDSPAFRRSAVALRRDLVALGPGVVVRVEDFYRRPNPALVADDRRGLLLPVVLAGDFDTAEANIERVTHAVDATPLADGLEAFTTGEASVAANFREVAEHDLRKGESIGLAVALVVLLYVFGTIVGALIPVVMALFAIGTALGLVVLVGNVVSLSVFVTNMTVGMGLALGIDYSLFVLTRYREERAEGAAVNDAIETAAGTSSRAVFFSGLAVVLALFGMSLAPVPTLRSLGIGAMLVGATSVLATLTLLPALLALLGDRVDRLRVPFLGRATGRWEQRFWQAAATGVMRHPVISLVLGISVLVLAALPALDLNTGTAGVSTLPDGAAAKQGFTVLQQRFPAASSDPVEIVVAGDVDSRAVEAGIERLEDRLADTPLWGPPRVEVNEDRDLAVVSVPITGDPRSEEATTAVETLRELDIPLAFAGVDARVLVTGTTARDVDFVDLATQAIPLVIAFVLSLSFVLLMIAFRSIVVPVKAVVMNLLSVGAAYGLIVLVFEKGVGADLFGFQQVEQIEAWVPVFLFAVLFGLSMDYHVFLLSRIRERFNETGDNRGAVEYGVTSTARIITGAALIMVAVFSGFALGQLVPFQQLGFGMAVALLIDATLVRSVLVPAGMVLLGARNWYLPRWLRWLPEVTIEGPTKTAQGRPVDGGLATEPAAP